MAGKFSKMVFGTATLAGSIIGVGFFSLPYITSQVGLWIMLAYFLVLGLLVALIHLLFGEVALKTPDFLRLPSYAQIYLGSWGKITALLAIVFGFLGAILAYLVIGGEFLTNLLSPIFGGNSLIYTLLYFSAGALLILFGIKAISKVHFLGLSLFFIILIIIFFKGLPSLRLENLFLISHQSFGLGNLFLPYGPILFALWGTSMIPEIEEMLGESKSLLRKIIPIGILIPAIVYLFFIFMVLGIAGVNTSPEAISGLKSYLGTGIISLAFLAGIITTFNAFLSTGLTLKKTLWYDFKIPKNIAWAITCFVPLFLFLIGLKDFIKIISFVGGVMLGIDGILILLMYQKISKKKLLTYPLISVLLGGIIYEIIYFFR